MAEGAPPLDGLRVVEEASGLAATYAGFLLAGLGADVVKLEAGAARRPTPGAHVLARGKRSATLDAGRADDAATRSALVAAADLLLTDESVAAVGAPAGVVHCDVTTWGRDGHPRGLPRDEALVAASTGVQALQWSWSGRPVWLVTPVIGYMTGLLAALGSVAALFARRRGAPAQRLEVSAVEGAFALNSGTYVSGAEHYASLSAQGEPRGVYPTYGLYQTADGWLFVGALTQAFWVKLMTVLERPDLLAHPRLQVTPLAFGLAEIRALVRAELEPIFARRPTAAWERLFRDADIPCGPVQTREEFLRDPEARTLGLVVPVDDPVLGPTWQPGVIAEFAATPLAPPRPAPPPGADTDAVRRETRNAHADAGPRTPTAPATCLEGIRVLDLASFIAGPFCPMLLADLGAEVVKVESPDGDPFRMAAFGFVGWNRGKRSLVLDLKRPEGREVFLDLVRAADVVVENFRGGVMERLGLGWETLAGANPRLVHTSITGYGSAGPLASLPGFDPVFQARSGLMQAQGGVDEPVVHMIAYNDYCAGALGALATVAALMARERTGRGQRVDVSLFRTAFVDQAAEMLLHDGAPAKPGGGRDFPGPTAGRRIYACRDGWVCVAAGTSDEAAALGDVAGVPVSPDAPAEGAVADAVARVLAALATREALERLDAAGVPAAPCLAFMDLLADPWLRARGSIAEAGHPSLGPLLMSGPFIRFAATPCTLRRSAPLLGADGADVLTEIGYPAARIAALVESGIVGPPA
jgi:crotonobetainyl-CoA:carnitine CoA-transferase CaiB-like acyl-CoA transferase